MVKVFIEQSAEQLDHEPTQSTSGTHIVVTFGEPNEHETLSSTAVKPSSQNIVHDIPWPSKPSDEHVPILPFSGAIKPVQFAGSHTTELVRTPALQVGCCEPAEILYPASQASVQD